MAISSACRWASALPAFVAGHAALAADYHVSPGGADGNPGTVAAPWRTLARAAAALQPGDTCHLRGGVYRERLLAVRSGAAGAAIVFAGFPGERPILDGTDVNWGTDPSMLQGLVDFQGHSHLRVRGLEVRNSTRSGIGAWSDGRGSNLVIEDNLISETNASGIGVWNYRAVTVTGNRLVRTCLQGFQECITMRNVDDFTVSRNEVSGRGEGGNGGEGIDAKQGSRNGRIFDNTIHDLDRLGIYIDAADTAFGDTQHIEVYGNEVYRAHGIRLSAEKGGRLHDIRVFRNTVRDCVGAGFTIGWGEATIANRRIENVDLFENISRHNTHGFAIHGVSFTAAATQRLANIRVFNNLAHHNREGGFALDAELRNGVPRDAMAVDNIVVANNTFFQNGTTAWGGGIILREATLAVGPGGVRIINNLIADTLTGEPWPYHIHIVGEPAVFRISHNLLHPLRSSDWAGASPVTQPPLFADAANADFRLLSLSPARDAGTAPDAPASDFDGLPRPAGPAWDIGAFEIPANPRLRISNLSVLTRLTAVDPFFALGTVIGGPATAGAKPVFFRAAGPSLAGFGVADALADPALDVFAGSALIASNDDWGGGAALAAIFAQTGAFAFAAPGSKDAAVFRAELPPGTCTVRVRAAEGATGTVLAEVYDATPESAWNEGAPRLVNVSVLQQVPAGEVLTAGFVLAGPVARTMLVRAVGPALARAPFNVPDAMADPRLDLYRGRTAIGANDDWGGGPVLAAAFARVGAFALPESGRDAALLVALPPGDYTVQVRNVDPSGGRVLIEVYEVP